MNRAATLKIEKIITSILQIYPKRLRADLMSAVIVSNEQRSRGDEKIDGSYDLETGEIILWRPDEEDFDGLFIVLTHEWGHKLYHEALSDDDRAKWLRFRSEAIIDLGLNAYYSSQQLPEEEYASLFSLVSQVLYWRHTGMTTKFKKLAKKLDKKVPQARELIESHLKKSSFKKHPQKIRSIYHREVENMKKWIREAVS